MLRGFLFFVLLLNVFSATAQIKVTADDPFADSLHVVFHDDKWAVEHIVETGDNVFMLSRRYHVPPALLADMNGINYQSGLQENSIIYIPLGAYNQVTHEPDNMYNVRPLYYIVRKYDNLFRIAHMIGVQQREVQKWNGMADNYIEEGRRLNVGWVLCEPSRKKVTDMTPASGPTIEKEVDTPGKEERKWIYDTTFKVNENGETVITITKEPFMTPIEKLYMEQTSDETVVMEEKGTAVFFDMKGRLQSSTMFYAFHNTAKRGTIIKVFNPGTDKTVFVKVLGPIPDAKQYHNCIIGISSGAKKELLVEEDKAWCELKFQPAL